MRQIQPPTLISLGKAYLTASTRYALITTDVNRVAAALSDIKASGDSSDYDSVVVSAIRSMNHVKSTAGLCVDKAKKNFVSLLVEKMREFNRASTRSEVINTELSDLG
jgi:hypothetical protein